MNKANEFKKDVITLGDGRYLIYYDFSEEPVDNDNKKLVDDKELVDNGNKKEG